MGDSEPGVSVADLVEDTPELETAAISAEAGVESEGEARADLAEGPDDESGLAPVGRAGGRTKVAAPLPAADGLSAIRSSSEASSSKGFRNGSKADDGKAGGKQNAGADGDDSSSGDASGVAVEPEVVRLR